MIPASTSPVPAVASAGLPVMASEKSIAARIDAVREALRRFPDGDPGFVVDPQKCPTLIRGFQGGYRYKKIKTNDGGYAEEPDKRSASGALYSHVHDALQYIMAPFELPMMRGGFMPGWLDCVNRPRPIARHAPVRDFDVWNL